MLLEKRSQRVVAVSIENYDVVFKDIDVAGHRRRQIPEAGVVEFRSGIQTGELAKVVDHRRVRGQLQLVGQRLASVVERRQLVVQQLLRCQPSLCRRAAVNRSVKLQTNRIATASQAKHDQSDLIPHLFQKWVDHGLGMLGRQLVLFERTKIAHAGRLGSRPALTVVDAPRVNHDDGGFLGAESIGQLDNAARVVRKSPGPHAQIGVAVIDQSSRLESPHLSDRLHEFRVIAQQRRRIFQQRQRVVVSTSRCDFLSDGMLHESQATKRHRQHEPSSQRS